MESILDQVISSKHASDLANFNPSQILGDILLSLNDREQEIIKMRHGLFGSSKKTLEEIGKQYNVTRERIRQIENSSLKKINKKFDKSYLKEIETLANTILSEHGGMMSEDNLINELLMSSNSKDDKTAIHFIINQLLKDRFYLHKESKNTHSFWKTPEASLDYFNELITNISELIKEYNTTLLLDKLMSKVIEKEFYSSDDSLTEKVVLNFLDISKEIKSNPYEEWGLTDWPAITPRRMNDKIHLVLEKKEKPMHFTDIADSINRVKFDHRKAYPATIHNELILNNRYVLVGRGIYALKKWGYKPGVVSDVIVDILKKSEHPLSKKDIIDEVLKKRVIKKTTISLALMDKNIFAKDEKGRYFLKNN